MQQLASSLLLKLTYVTYILSEWKRDFLLLVFFPILNLNISLFLILNMIYFFATFYH